MFNFSTPIPSSKFSSSCRTKIRLWSSVTLYSVWPFSLYFIDIPSLPCLQEDKCILCRLNPLSVMVSVLSFTRLYIAVFLLWMHAVSSNQFVIGVCQKSYQSSQIISNGWLSNQSSIQLTTKKLLWQGFLRARASRSFSASDSERERRRAGERVRGVMSFSPDPILIDWLCFGYFLTDLFFIAVKLPSHFF